MLKFLAVTKAAVQKSTVFQSKIGKSRKRFEDGQKKNPVKLLDRDKTKNKHYEQTLIFWRIFEEKKSPD